MDISDNVYIQTNQNDGIIIIKLYPFESNSIKPIYIRMFGDIDYPINGGATILTANNDHLYIGGSFEGNLLLLKINANDASPIFVTTTKYTDGTNN